VLTTRIASISGALAFAFLMFFGPSQPAHAALSCGTYKYPFCQAAATQYAGGFNPGVGYGGFGGGTCTATHTPVVFVHGNGDSALGWASPANTAPAGYPVQNQSVYDYFKAKGYNDCELFGITYLSSTEQSGAGTNYHQQSKYAIVQTFIDRVKAYTGKAQVDLVTHSLGSSMSLATLRYYGSWSSVRRFVNIAGGIRGLNSCLYTGYANPYVTTCGSENLLDSNVFGFFPDTGVYGYGNNRWTGSGASGMRNLPATATAVRFYTIGAGQQDEVHCSTASGWSTCAAGPTFTARTNVISQVNIGAGSTAIQYDFNLTDGFFTNVNGGDTNGVGHFKARNNGSTIIYDMLNTSCTGVACANNYVYGPKVSY